MFGRLVLIEGRVEGTIFNVATLLLSAARPHLA